MRFMKLPEVMHITGLKKSSIYGKIKEGGFPPNIKLGARAVAWNSDSIEAWLNERIEQL